MLDKIDRALHMPLWVACTITGLLIDEIRFYKIRRRIRGS